VRKVTQPPKNKICALCKRPIEPGQRPSVQMENGDEVHIECFSKLENRSPRGRRH